MITYNFPTCQKCHSIEITLAWGYIKCRDCGHMERVEPRPFKAYNVKEIDSPDKMSGKEGDMQNATNNVANRIREKT
jgi:DNA-directed RNA polymerase subunit M/transcription elongation factor TFIIS